MQFHCASKTNHFELVFTLVETEKFAMLAEFQQNATD